MKYKTRRQLKKEINSLKIELTLVQTLLSLYRALAANPLPENDKNLERKMDDFDRSLKKNKWNHFHNEKKNFLPEKSFRW